jgi:predicted ArsR family transcriptional regulator
LTGIVSKIAHLKRATSAMKLQPWQQRLLESTRGQILALLHDQPRTVNDLAAALGITDNAVRAHLISLERDGLIQRRGVRRGIRKPHVSYGLSAEAEHIFPKAYGLLLNYLLSSVSRRFTPRQVVAVMRELGHALAREHTPKLIRKSRPERVTAALGVIKSLGGSPAAFRVDGQRIIRGNTCPLAAVTAEHPAACLIVETLLSDIIGLPVHEHCTRGHPPACCFEIS